MGLEYILLLFCLLFSAFCSGTETAFTSLSQVQIVSIKETRGRRGRLIKRLSARYDYFLVAVLVGNTFANVAASVLCTRIAQNLFGNNVLGITTGILTFVILIFCELTPKRLSIVQNEWIAVHTIDIVYPMMIIMKPLSWLLLLLNSIYSRLFGTQKQTMTVEGLNYLIHHAENLGVLENSRSQIIQNTFKLNNITLAEVMTHRREIFSLEQNMNIEDALPAIGEKNFSRIPVYSKEVENIVGVLNIKQLLRHIGQTKLQIKKIMLPPLFLPSHRRLNDVLNLFLQEKANMAIVLDEYGGVEGIATIEDILEEIVGEIYDEHEIRPKNQHTLLRVNPGTYKISGKTSLSTLQPLVTEKIKNVRHQRTVSGYLISCLGHLPAVGEVVTTPMGIFTIQSLSRHRIDTVLFEPLDDHHS